MATIDKSKPVEIWYRKCVMSPNIVVWELIKNFIGIVSITYSEPDGFATSPWRNEENVQVTIDWLP